MSWACAFAFAGSLLVGNAHAQGLRQPLSVRPAAFNYEHYLQDDVASPSDAPPAAPESVIAEPAPSDPEPAAAAAPAIAAPSDCCTTCAPAPCCCSCDSGCGGLGLGLGDCNLGEAFGISDCLFGSCSPWSAGGWTQVGYHEKNNGLFNNHATNFNIHQSWMYLEKAAQPTNGGLDWGFRTDILYGVDAADTQAFGNTVDAAGNPRGYDTGWNHGIYGWALPQLYGEVAGDGWSVKAGHFFTLVGYEVIPATGNFFYSHAFTMYNSEPFTHTGVLATYSISEDIEGYAGWTLGWDTGFDQFEDGSNWLGGFSATLTEDVTLTYISTIGDFGWRGEDGYMSSVVLDTQLTDKLNYVFHSDLLRVDSTQEDNYSINQYLFYDVNDCLALGTRVEWWKTDDLGALGLGSFSVYEATFGANIRPHANITVRPEVRQEWSPALDADQTIFAFDTYVTY